MNDFAWYGRLLVWTGAAVLLVESVTGRTLGPLSTAAVLAMSAGLISFVGGLAAEGLRQVWVPAADTPRVPEQVTALAETRHLVSEDPVSPEAADLLADDMPLSGTVPDPAKKAATRFVGDEETGLTCIRCGQDVGPGQVAATCWNCDGIHHAGCWTENRFRCARPGCAGHGGLEEPELSDA